MASYLNYVSQRTLSDCGIAVAAMLADVSYERAAQVTPRKVFRQGMYYCEMLALLEQLTGTGWRRTSLRRRCSLSQVIEALSASSRPAAICIRSPNGRAKHYIAVQNQLVYCPAYHEDAPCLPARYKRRNWPPLTYITRATGGVGR
jgi:hypothetical protein